MKKKVKKSYRKNITKKNHYEELLRNIYYRRSRSLIIYLEGGGCYC